MAYLWFILLAVTFIGFVGLSIDVAHIVYTRQQLQDAADAACMAGAQYVRDGSEEARLAAIQIALANKAAGVSIQLVDNPANSPDGDIIIGHYNRSTRVFAPGLTGVNAVKVVARRRSDSPSGPVNLLFGPVFGVETINLTRSAIAMTGGGTGAGLICLNETNKWTFRLSGNVLLDVTDSTTPDGEGAIQINSANDEALKFDGTSGRLEGGPINVYADSVNYPPPIVYDGDVNASQPRIPDPLAGIAPPPPGPDLGTVKITGGTHLLSPGYYSGGIYMTGGTVTLQPGIYTVAGEGLKVTGGDLIAHEVMFYVLPGKKSSVDLAGNGTVDITPIPLDQEPYGGIAIWQSKDNTNPANLRGTDQFSGIDGTLYFPKALVNVVGTSDSFAIRQLICDSATISGSGTVTINYDGRNVAPGGKVFLVE